MEVAEALFPGSGDERRSVLQTCRIEDFNFVVNFHPAIPHNYDSLRESGSARLVRLRRRKNVFTLPCEGKRCGIVAQFEFFSSGNVLVVRMEFPQAIEAIALTFLRPTALSESTTKSFPVAGSASLVVAACLIPLV